MTKQVEIKLDENQCQGCGYCELFCPQNCIELTKDNFNLKGFLVPVISNPEKCSGCGICVWMCPAMAITVRKNDAEPVK